jgi:hypothetical protein
VQDPPGEDESAPREDAVSEDVKLEKAVDIAIAEFHTILVTVAPQVATGSFNRLNRAGTHRIRLDGSSSVAQHINVMIVDDIDGSEASETVSFGLDGRRYDIDLSKDHAAQLRDTLASFILTLIKLLILRVGEWPDLRVRCRGRRDVRTKSIS